VQALHLLLICIVPFSGALPLRLAPTALLFQCVLRQLVLAAGGLGGAGVQARYCASSALALAAS